MTTHKNETEYLPLPITENCETLIKQTHSEAEETLEFKLTQQEKNLFSIYLYRLKDLG